MTADEAAHRICHVSMSKAKPSKCLVSECMAWRWMVGGSHEIVTTEHRRGFTNPDFPPGGHEAGWEKIDSHSDGRYVRWRRPWGAQREGFCGLAEPRVVDVLVAKE